MSEPPIDRLSPTRRPAERAYAYQSWRSLLFLHWEVPVRAVRPLVPAELELDLFDGRLLVGVVPFEMEDVRPWSWWPRRLAFQFLETNLRTYVHFRGEPGVFFLSLDAQSRLAVWGARLGWSLPYFHARMRCERSEAETHYITRRSHRAASLDVRYRIGAPLGPSAPGSLEYFLLERYLLFVRHRGRLWSGQVHHVPYPAQRAEVLSVEESLFAAAGLPPSSGLPPYSHYSPGVDVEIFRLRRR